MFCEFKCQCVCVRIQVHVYVRACRKCVCFHENLEPTPNQCTLGACLCVMCDICVCVCVFCLCIMNPYRTKMHTRMCARVCCVCVCVCVSVLCVCTRVHVRLPASMTPLGAARLSCPELLSLLQALMYRVHTCVCTYYILPCQSRQFLIFRPNLFPMHA